MTSVRRLGNVFAVEADTESTSRADRRRGRKPFKWNEMHVELGRMIERGEVPQKKEALIAHLMEWCREKWGRPVSRSAIQGQLQGVDPAKK